MKNKWFRKRDVLLEKFVGNDALLKAEEVLQRDEQSEEAFLGAQGILLLHGLL